MKTSLSQVEEFFRFVKAMKNSLWRYGRQPGFKGRDSAAELATGDVKRDLLRSTKELQLQLQRGIGGSRAFGGGAASHGLTWEQQEAMMGAAARGSLPFAPGSKARASRRMTAR